MSGYDNKYGSAENMDAYFFPEAHVERFRELGEVLQLPKNYILNKAGEIPDCCYYIEQGQVVSYEYTVSGGEHIFSSSNAGAMLLLPSMVITHRLTLSFKTSRPSQLIRLKRKVLYGIMEEEPDIAAEFVYSLSARLIATIERYREQGSYNVEWRVSNLLLTLAEQNGVDYDGKVLIQEKMSQQTMANHLQANRVTIARAIRELKNYGLVEIINGFYCIRDVEKLKRHMDKMI